MTTTTRIHHTPYDTTLESRKPPPLKTEEGQKVSEAPAGAGGAANPWRLQSTTEQLKPFQTSDPSDSQALGGGKQNFTF